MNKAICSLNFMYSMERFATAIYRIQGGGFKEKVISERMTYAIDNERQHALSLRNRIIELNNTPSRFAFLFQMTGILLGLLSRCSGKMLALKIDGVIERKAVKDYGYFLKTLELDDKTKLLIESIIADEELHIRNWQDSVGMLRSKA